MEKSDELRKQMQRVGKEIFGSLDMNTLLMNKRSIMFPPSPASPFIDKFPAENLSGAEKRSAKQQREYEGEVKVYRTLEMLLHRLVVLHNFKYTHQQYKLFVAHECKRRDGEEEGEADFIVIHNNLIAIVEVKTAEFDKKNSKVVFERNYKKSKQQIERTTLLIKGICSKYGTAEPEIRYITVFTSITKKSASEISKYTSLSQDAKDSILFCDDLCRVGEGNNGFDAMLQLSEKRQDIDAVVLWTLLGLWCADDKNQFAREKWELGRKINSTDSLIRDAIISNKPEGPTSSKIKGSPAIFKKMGIKCLTVEQKNVFYDIRPKLMINGPAGTGKTILMIGKVIQLARTSEVRIIVFVANVLAAKDFQKQLQTSEINSQIFIGRSMLETNIPADLKVLIHYFTDEDHPALGRLGINVVDKLYRLCDAFQSDFHMFIDDFHVFSPSCKIAKWMTPLILSDEIKDFWQYVQCRMKESSPKVIWISYDSLQELTDVCYQQLGQIHEWTYNTTVHKLSSNLRNSFEIEKFLGFLRFYRRTFIMIKINAINSFVAADRFDKESFFSFCKFDQFDVTQEKGHYIHGPMPIIRWVDLYGIVKEEHSLLLKCTVKREIEKLLDCGTIAIIHDEKNPRKIGTNGVGNYLVSLEEICFEVKEGIDTEFAGYGVDLSIHHIDEAVSGEWPAVVGIIEVNENKIQTVWSRMFEKDKVENQIVSRQLSMDALLAKMYTIASRGRTYVTLICVVDFKEPLYSMICHKENKAMLYKRMGFDFIDMTLFGGSNPEHRENEYEPLDLSQDQIKAFLQNIQYDVAVSVPYGKTLLSKVFAERIASRLRLDLDLDLYVGTLSQTDVLKFMITPKLSLHLTKKNVARLFRNMSRIKPWIGNFISLADFYVHHEICGPFMMKIISKQCRDENIPYPPGEEELLKLIQGLSTEENVHPLITEEFIITQDYRLLFESMSPEKKYAEKKSMILALDKAPVPPTRRAETYLNHRTFPFWTITEILSNL